VTDFIPRQAETNL